jgi:hypothetical protein
MGYSRPADYRSQLILRSRCTTRFLFGLVWWQQPLPEPLDPTIRRFAGARQVLQQFALDRHALCIA